MLGPGIKSAVKRIVERTARLVSPFSGPMLRDMRVRMAALERDVAHLSAAAPVYGVPRDPGHQWNVLQIPLTDLCERRCRHCTKWPGDTYFGVLPLEAFERYLMRFFPRWFRMLCLSDWGEVMVIKNILDYLYAAKRRGWDSIHFVTSDSRFDEHRAAWEAMVAERLIDKVAVSTEAADPALYESIRRTPFDGFLRLLRGLVSLRDEYGSPLDITLAVTCMRENLRDLPNIVSLAAAHGVRRVEMQHLNAVRFAEGEAADKLCVPEQHLREAPREEVLSVLRRVKEEAARGGIRLVLPEGYPELSDVTCPPGLTPPPSPLRCMVPYDWVNVWFNGEVFPCCAIGHQYSLGSVDKLDFFSIWNNLKYRRLLDGLRPGGEPIEPCRRCSLLSV